MSSADIANEHGGQGNLSRRGFLEFVTKAGVAAAFGTLGYKLTKYLGANSDRFSDMFLKLQVKEGKFAGERPGKVSTNLDLLREISFTFDEDPEISQGQVIVAQGDFGKIYKHHVDQNEPFYPASTIKLAICIEAYKLNPQALPIDLAIKILTYSTNNLTPLFDNLGDLITGNDESQKVYNLLSNGGLPITSEPGEFPLSVKMVDYLNYLRTQSLPQVIKDAMRQNKEDYSAYYGLSEVLGQHYDLDNVPTYFKIGLINHPTRAGELINPYYFRIERDDGKDLHVYGFASGKNKQAVHAQMLKTASLIGSYVKNNIIQSAS